MPFCQSTALPFSPTPNNEDSPDGKNLAHALISLRQFVGRGHQSPPCRLAMSEVAICRKLSWPAIAQHLS